MINRYIKIGSLIFSHPLNIKTHLLVFQISSYTNECPSTPLKMSGCHTQDDLLSHFAACPERSRRGVEV
jgi:hypothetical protein